MGTTIRDCLERRSDMMHFLSLVRKTHSHTLIEKYHISRSTLHSDLKSLANDYKVPFTSTRGPDGYIKVMDGWYADRKYLKEEQADALKKVLSGQQPDERDKEMLQTILNDFDLKTMMEQIKDL